jgi:Kef-type K+ transport system membrane component KefB
MQALTNAELVSLELKMSIPPALLGVARSAGSGPDELVLSLLLQLVVLLSVTGVVVQLAKKVGQTQVSGEILAGLLFGPSCLGALFPGLLERLFPPSSGATFSAIAQLGLVLLLFQIGLEFEFKAQLSDSRRSVFVISGVGLLVPFLAGLATAPWFYETLQEPRPNALGFRLFFATSMSVTAIPILGRIFMELGLSHTRTAALTIGAAAIDDTAGWLILGVVSLLVENQFAPGLFAVRFLGLGAYIAAVLLVARPVLKRFVARDRERGGALSLRATAVLLIAAFASGSISSALGVFAIIGGFLIGLSLHDDRRLVADWKLRVSPLVNTLFLPVFFAHTGLRTEIGTIRTARDVWITVLVCAVAFASKFGGCYLGARLMKEKHAHALAIGVCMNTRALMELVALNVGYDLGLLPRSMFTKLVLMAIVSTFIASPLIGRILAKERRQTLDLDGRSPSKVGPDLLATSRPAPAAVGATWKESEAQEGGSTALR